MKKKIIIILVILATVSISGCINSPLDNINEIIPNLSQHIVNGDNNYNEAVKAVNNLDYAIADEKAKTAKSEFNEAQNNLLEINKYTDNINETLYLQYIQLLKEEINLKQNATKNLQLATEYFESGSISSANSYVDIANSLMDQGITIQKEREQIIKDNPGKFQ
ncbi:MAG: hypothetical protein LBM26_01680 [Methanobrevibacter sp.]|jgi:cellobiose-specific phosphotransferase system component IIA|nr:hypothetical protein [Methanobrevibacter sp.]